MKKHVLTDVDNRIWEDDFHISSENWSVTKKTLHGGLQDGVDIIDINNGTFSFSVLPTRGMGIWKGKFADCKVGWNSPSQGPVHPKFVNLTERNGIGWLKGFDEMIVRCGLTYHGQPSYDGEDFLPLHGKIANIPARFVAVEVDDDKISIEGVVDESEMFGPQFRLYTKIETEFCSNKITITDEIENIGGTESEMEVLYHCNFGEPILEKGSKLVLPIQEMSPRNEDAVNGLKTVDVFDAPTPNYPEQCFFYKLLAKSNGKTLAILKNATSEKAVVLRFNKKELPCFTLWKNTVAEKDGYVTGLEPGTSYPNPKSYEREKRRLKNLAPGEKHSMTLSLEILNSKKEISKVVKEVNEIQKKKKRKIHETPNPKFTIV